MDDSPPPAPRSIPPELLAAFVDDGDQSVFESEDVSLDGVFGSRNTLEEPPLPDVPAGPPPSLPDELLQSGEDSAFGAPFSSSPSVHHRSISPGFPFSYEREPASSRSEESTSVFARRSPQTLQDAALPIETMPTRGPLLHHRTKDRPKRTVSKPSRNKLRSLLSRDDSVDAPAAMDTDRGLSSVLDSSSPTETLSKVSDQKTDSHPAKSSEENVPVEGLNTSIAHAIQRTTGLLHHDRFGVSDGSKVSPSIADLVQKVKPSLSTHQKVTPTSFSSRLRKIRRSRGSGLSEGAFNGDSPGNDPALSHLTSNPFLHASTSSLGSETLSLSATSGMSLAEEILATQEKGNSKGEEVDDGGQIHADAFRVSSPLDSPQILLHPFAPDEAPAPDVPKSVSSTVSAPFSSAFQSSFPRPLPTPLSSLSPSKPSSSADIGAEPSRVVNVAVEEVEWPTAPPSLVSGNRAPSFPLPQDVYKASDAELDQPPTEPEGPPPPLPPSSFPPLLSSEPFEEQPDLNSETMATSQASEQSTSLHLSPVNIDLSSEPSSTLTTMSDSKSPDMESIQYVENESRVQHTVGKQLRVERSRSVYSDTAEKESVILKPNLKRWGAADLDKISNLSGSSDVLPDSLTASFFSRGRELRSAKSAMEFPSRPRSSSGLSWVSAETGDRSLESIVEVAPDTPLTTFAEPAVKQRPATATIPRPDANYLMEDELISSASTGNITYLHELASGSPLKPSFEQTRSNFRETSISPTVSSESRERLPVMSVPLPSRSDPVSIHSPMVEGGASAVQDGGGKSSETNPNSLAGDIPKSMSSLLEAVVSNLPSFATSSTMVDDDTAIGNLPPKVATGDLIPTAAPCQVAWCETTPTNDTPTMDTSVEVSVFVHYK